MMTETILLGAMWLGSAASGLPHQADTSQATQQCRIVEALDGAANGLNAPDGVERLGSVMRLARETDAVDATVLERTRRMLQVLWLSGITDREGILRPIVDRELNSFIEGQTGIKNAMALDVGQAIGAFSDATARELTLLRFDLGCTDRTPPTRVGEQVAEPGPRLRSDGNYTSVERIEWSPGQWFWEEWVFRSDGTCDSHGIGGPEPPTYVVPPPPPPPGERGHVYTVTGNQLIIRDGTGKEVARGTILTADLIELGGVQYKFRPW